MGIGFSSEAVKQALTTLVATHRSQFSSVGVSLPDNRSDRWSVWTGPSDDMGRVSAPTRVWRCPRRQA